MYKIWMCCGLGSNSKGELLTLWVILLLSNHLKSDGIQIYGDSKVLIDWDSNDNNVNILPILTWMKNIILLISKFKDIYFSHVYRKQNQLADPLSKKVLQVEEGFIFSGFWENGSLISEDKIWIFQSYFCPYICVDK